jgi:hypothetical protein
MTLQEQIQELQNRTVALKEVQDAQTAISEIRSREPKGNIMLTPVDADTLIISGAGQRFTMRCENFLEQFLGLMETKITERLNELS